MHEGANLRVAIEMRKVTFGGGRKNAYIIENFYKIVLRKCGVMTNCVPLFQLLFKSPIGDQVQNCKQHHCTRDKMTKVEAPDHE